MKSNTPKPTTLPRRANTIRAIAAQMASRKLAEEMTELNRRVEVASARKVVSDRIGYAVAVLLGGAVGYFGGWVGVGAFVVGYTFAAWRAYRAWREMAE